MQNRPSKHRSLFKQKNHTHVAPKDDQGVIRKPFSVFLIETGFWPLAFAGRCMQQFGFGAVAGFLLGAGFVYGYSFFVKPLPGIKAAAPIVQTVPIVTPSPVLPKTVWLHGRVNDNDKPRKEEFEIGVLATRQGPFQDGSYSIQVPESDSYRVTLWNVGYQKFKLVELKADSAGNVNDVNFPADVAKVEPPKNKQRNEPSDIYASVRDRRPKEKPDATLRREKETESNLANRPEVDKRSQL